ncbi:metacaspase-2-like isoform X2 [Pieris napi]|uniref:metacaspase-2-like isoform X2 n=1 Tax=Pieris napi TaxID=78633 RepID=UPI001FBBEA81|nr:metacaspase-2-like isoform X2 [Pieris napi]
MACKEKEIKKPCVLLFLAMVISQVTFISAIDSDCKGKAFYCLNSTHFMICLDLGDGVSTTVEDFIIPCPPPTICIETNDFECEYHTTTTLKPILQSEVPVTELNAQTRDDSDYTTFLPFWYNKEDSVRSEKYYDILDDQLTTRETSPETSTHQESTTETQINDEMNIERTTFTQVEKSTLPPTFYTITEDVTISSQQVNVVVNNKVSDGYDNHFDTVRTTTLSESTTQTTTRYDETQPTSGYIDEHISSNNIISTKEEPPILNFYTYQEETTTYAPLNLDFWPDGITQTTNFASDKLTTTVQETKNEEIKGTTNREISYSLTTEIEKYLNTYSDYVDTFSPITSFQEAGKMPNEVTNTKRNYEITTELHNYINNNKFDTTTPSVTLQQENRIVKDVFTTNITDASNTEDYVYNNSIPKIPEEDTTVNYGKTEDTAINHSNTIDANINYINNNKFDTTTPSVTLQQENKIVKDVFTTNITDASNTEDYVYNNSIPKIPEEDTTVNYGKTEDTAINHSNTIDANINYINNNKFDTTTPSVTLQQENRIVKYVFTTNITDASNTEDYVYYNSIPKIPEEDTTMNYGKTEDTAINHSNTIDANLNYINNNKFDTTTPSVTLQQENRIVKDVFTTNITDASNTEDYVYNNSIPKIPEEDTTMIYGKTEDTAINHSNTIDANINYPTTTDIHEYINNIVSTTKENIINDEYEAKYFPKSTTIIDESSFIGIKYMTRPYVSQIFNNDVNQITYKEEENTHSSSFSPNANINVILKNSQDITTSTDVSYGNLMVNEMSSQTDKNFSEIKQTTSKVPVTGYIMQDNTSPYNPKGTIQNDEKSLVSIENITVLNDIVSSSTKDDLKEINLESTDPLDYQISTDSSLLSPIETPSIIKDNLIVPIFSALDNVTEIKINDTIISGKYNNHNMKQSNYKNQDKTNPNFYTTFTQSNAPTSSSPGYAYDTTLPDLVNPKTTSSELISDMKTMDTYIKETAISEQRNTDVYTFSIEDRTKRTELTTSPWLKNTESNNNQYEITKEMNVIYHDKIPDAASTTPSIFDLNNLETVTIDDKNNLEKTVTKPSTELKSTLSISQDGSSANNLFTFTNDMFTTSYVNATESYALSNFQDNGITESANYIQESKPTNKTKYEDKHSSFVGNTYPTVNKLPDNIPDITTETIHKLSTRVPSVPIIAIINGSKKVARYSEDSKIEGAGDAIKLPAMEVNNTNATRNKTVVVSNSAKTLNSSLLNSKVPVISNASNINNAAEMKSPSIALAHNISLDRHETIGNKQSVYPNIQEKKETVSVQINQPCNKTIPDTTNRSNKTSPTITSEQLNLTCLNRYSGKYPDQNNCQTFYMCIGTMSPIVGHCPQNSVFSDILNQCTRNLSHCVRNNEFQCVSPGRFSDLWSRDTYYICVRHKSKFVRFRLRCQKGYILNRTSITCVEDPVIEKQSFTLESYSTSSSSSSSDSKSGQIESNTDVEFKCKKEGVFPDPNHCRKYYVCKKISKSKIRLKKKNCDSDEVFNKKKKKCVDEDSYECET